MISFIIRSAFFIPAFDSADETRTHLIENLRIISNGTKDFRNVDAQELPGQILVKENSNYELVEIGNFVSRCRVLWK
ncbi:Oidioi.mRNA.OKI2018_I69.chr2.g7300.t1.cds [Oikopleura dioica]|uniref:Oidioi.mRNA.OKI2018_I69.chr2.g7300.t1.cds n=1 Tax=Oikopleura dioica TaxID=34765 RepID=A0ABN7T5R0_OIKDI|nr:Oidioi.mRNA.OKI2018_I69.chr2.g7300.t1.cds [Oikopleura dioica]